MTNDKGILIKNIYYMLTYAFQILRQSNYDEIAAEDFENIHDMFAAILGKGVAQQLKQGLYREYVENADDLPTLRGKLAFNGTIKNRLQHKQLLSCEYDELSENNLMNQVLKTTMLLLIKQPNVKQENKAVLKKDLVYFNDVEYVEPANIRWDRIQYQRNNQSYRMLLNVCRLVIDGMLLSTEQGTIKMATFLDDQRMSHLYEKFILEYYRYHHPELHANPDQVQWNLDDDNDMWLPSMITDITLKSKNGKVLILDAKYYGQQMQSNFDIQSFRNANLYQIFTYVKNRDTEHTGNVSGMLLYAKTNEDFQPSNDFLMDKNKISVGSLNLNLPFTDIAAQLEKIVVDNEL
ncbi:5-methylcytosine-specific restriction endonuclease system specificity protein McrC [Pseudobutyrivibrio sp.]|uniref:5-methylcytosine-specific restriction endonuclease system specificity protein McrC n=1 Tax=Pseudobutyrivibrio sp. TaxID=2014367 RepID=UPI001B6459F3|nr:5-methylcytosine-specific restriction endonuclease system specificity protein McrC [Pseudobutyrivibrio sp.]MBP3261214.1 5-methylcytosine-specific restriction endonuclease system specificity protein McrC [Pseudobutyrivibrio sp.]